jgi:LysM repeat protein
LGLLGVSLAPAASAAACATPYTVLPGDNLFRIGLAFGVPWSTIAAANNLTNASLIFPGQVLCIPSASGTPAPTATGPTPTPSATVAPTATATVAPAATGQPAPTAVPTVVSPPGFVPPTFSIVSVVKDTSVTIRTANFPPNQDFVVTMSSLNSLAVGGTVVSTTNSALGGVLTTTYTIPAGLAGTPQISIRMQSAGGYYSFNWFWNVTAPYCSHCIAVKNEIRGGQNPPRISFSVCLEPSAGRQRLCLQRT